MMCLLDAHQRRDNRAAKFARSLANGDVAAISGAGRPRLTLALGVRRSHLGEADVSTAGAGIAATYTLKD